MKRRPTTAFGTAQARAVENFLYVVITGSVGNMRTKIGSFMNYSQAAVLTPSDFAFPEGGLEGEADPNVEAVVISELALSALVQQRQVATVRPLHDRRPDLYHLAQVPHLGENDFLKIILAENGYLVGCIFPGFTIIHSYSVSKNANRVVVERSAFDGADLLPIIQACSSDRATEKSRENARRIGRWSSPIEPNAGRVSERLRGWASSRNLNAPASSERRKARRSRLTRNCNSSITRTSPSPSGSRSIRRMFGSRINSSLAEPGWHWN